MAKFDPAQIQNS